MARFVVVKFSTGEMGFTTFHPNEKEAQMEAERLCLKHGGEFLVMQVLGTMRRANPPLEYVKEE